MWRRVSYANNIATRVQSYKGFRRSFTTPICGTVNRDRYSASLRFVRLAVFRSAFFRALKTRTQCGNARSREVCTSLAHFCAPVGWFHLRRHSAPYVRSQLSKICGRCCVVPPSPSQTLSLPSSSDLYEFVSQLAPREGKTLAFEPRV